MTGSNSGKCILDALKTVNIFLSGAEKKKKRISVV